jgi:adenine-specific DNA-methyltransferase
MAYLKRWAPRASNPLQLREPSAVPGPAGTPRMGDANRLAAELGDVELAYLDPPYNQHSYAGNYHVWETIVRNDAPGHYGVACKRLDVRERRSPYNSKTAGVGGPLRTGVQPDDTLAGGVVLERGVPRAGRRAALLEQRRHVADRRRSTRPVTWARGSASTTRPAERVGRVSHLRNTSSCSCADRTARPLRSA